MPLFDITSVALERALSGASMRQQALSDNLANANVPGYQRKDVDFQGTLQTAMARGRPTLQSASFSITPTAEGAVRADGGTVDVDREATSLAQNSLMYESPATVVKSRSSILRTAIGGR